MHGVRKGQHGGKPLDAFELITAMYAAEGHELRKDWYGKGGDKGRQHRFVETLRHGGQDKGIIAEVSNTDFLQAVALFHNRDRRRQAEAEGKQGKELPPVAPNRQAILNPRWRPTRNTNTWSREGSSAPRSFCIGSTFSGFSICPISPRSSRWPQFWRTLARPASMRRTMPNSYAGTGTAFSASYMDRPSRAALDATFSRCPHRIRGGDLPTTIQEATFRPDRLKTMRMRLSAAYKGVNALLMNVGALDWRSGQKFDHAIFFGEAVDIHHIFPKDWCLKQGLKPEVLNSIINKTPLAYRTNSIIGGAAPSVYLAKIEAGGPEISGDRIPPCWIATSAPSH